MKTTTSSTSYWRWLRRALLGVVALVTLVALLYAEENWRGKHAWESFKKEQEAKGVSFDRESVIPPPVPDDQNYAMTPFLAPLSDLEQQGGHSRYRDTNGVHRAQEFANDDWNPPEDLTNWPNGKQFDWPLYMRTNTPDSPFSSPREAASALLAKFAKYQPVLDELRAASHRPYSRFNIAYHDANTAGILLAHLAVSKKFAQIWFLKSSAEITLGNSNAAADDLGQIFVVANSTRNEPILISHLVRLAVLNIATSDISNGISRHAWSDGQLQNFQAQLEKIRLIPELAHCMEGERVECGNPIFDLMRTDPHRLSEITADAATGDNSNQGTGFSLFPPGWLYFEQLNYNKLFLAEFNGSYDPGKGRVYPRIVKSNGVDLTNELNPGSIVKVIFQHKIFARLLLPALGKATEKTARVQTMVDEADVACALERYHLANGQYPDSLTALTPQYLAAIPNDVISGEPLKYRRTDDGQYVLYSVGWNETDDGGRIVFQSNGKTLDADQGDWVWASNP